MNSNDYKRIRQGDIFIADLGDGVGSVQRGIRPVLILQNDKGNVYSNTSIVIPITSKISKKDLPVHVKLNGNNLSGTGLLVESMLLMEQVRVVDKSQLRNKIGTVNEYILNQAIATMYINFTKQFSISKAVCCA